MCSNMSPSISSLTVGTPICRSSSGAVVTVVQLLEMPAIFKISCGATSYQPHSYKGGAFDTSFFFVCCTFPFRDLVDWSVSTIYWVEDSETQSIKEPTQTGSLESPVTCLSECGKKRTQIFHPHKPPCCPSKLDL